MYVAGENIIYRGKQDEAIRQRELQTRIRLSKLQDDIDAPFWVQRQQELYPNLTTISQPPSVADVLNPNIMDKLNTNTDIDNARIQAIQNLLTITGQDGKASEHIVNRLTPNDISAMNQYFENIKKEITKTFPKGLTREAFVSYIKQNITPKWLNTAPHDDLRDLGGASTIGDTASTIGFATDSDLHDMGDLYDDTYQTYDDTYQTYDDPYNFLPKEPDDAEYDTRKKAINRDAEQKASYLPPTTTSAPEIFMGDVYGDTPPIKEEENPLNEPPSNKKKKLEQYQEGIEDETLKNLLRLFNNARNKQEMMDKIGKCEKITVAQNKEIFDMYLSGSTKKEILNKVAEFFRIPVGHPVASEVYADDPEELGEPIPKAKGKGLNRRKKFYGKGKPIVCQTCHYSPFDSPHNVNITNNPNVYLELTKLKNNNILSLKYKSNRNTHPQLRQIRISQTLSDIIQEILDKKLNPKLMRLLKPNEKAILRQFLKITKITDVNVDADEMKRFNEQFDILVGEIESGNDNPELKNKLRQFINLGIKLKRIPRDEALTMLMSLK
jgi:hypothetical protein